MKRVKVTVTQNGGVNEVEMELGSGENYNKNYTAKRPLKIKFYQHPATGADKD
jgi:hypothetical protein